MSNYFNRELSWMEFNNRVLNEAKTESVPLLERLLFLGITSSNFDEFFMVRVATTIRAMRDNLKPTVAQISYFDVLNTINEKAHEMCQEQYRILNKDILPKLNKEGLQFVTEFDEAELQYLNTVYEREIFSVLTPLRIDTNKTIHNFVNLQMYLAVTLDKISTEEIEKEFAVIPMPASLSRLWELPSSQGADRKFVFLEDLVRLFSDRLFPGYKIVESSCFRLTKDADLAVDEDDDTNLLTAMEELIVQRGQSFPVRLEIDKKSEDIRERLKSFFQINSAGVYMVDGPVNLKGLMEICFISGYDHLHYDSRKPKFPRDLKRGENIFEELSKRDILMHHPYESFDPVLDLINQAVDDPNVLSIKMTLYRTSGSKSPVADALLRAARNGKQVTALVELKARFDEQQNIRWATQLEKVGATVIYGLSQLKVHCKFLMVTRRESTGVRRYVHLGTGNYNEKTATLYTDMGFMTSRDELTYEAALFFNSITGYSDLPQMDYIFMAPSTMKPKFLQLVNRETKIAENGGSGAIRAQFNSLSDPEMIEALYRASQAGVKIDLNIRGICMLKPGLEGLSDNITVVSVIGRYLEHSRIYWFSNGGKEEMYLASADWMSRNLNRRVELMFPVFEAKHKERVKHILDTMLSDNRKAHILQPDGTYVKRNRGKNSAQDLFYKEALEASKEDISEGLKVRRKLD
ncbi:polyphosphate kinase 1 [Lentisphaera marina]|uniref:polyphosphate kinase 1 n=1 Tax=Lentisphaera marina TaxID=1111041 RepID=UPI00236560E4|nr:polyphosphate kinase 1 [Lentisphaera marina]MDD7987027.1 polyphosphate kinase 1 [Lentisphaera marina]